MKIIDILKQDKPIFSFEFFPPKDDEGFERLFKTIDNLKSCEPAFVSVTYGAGGSTRSKTIELVGRIKKEIGLESMAHLTCVGHSSDELFHILDSIKLQDIDNVLALRGDPPADVINFTKPDNGFGYAQELVQFIRERFSFCIGVAGYPEGHPESTNRKEDLLHLKNKVLAGASFIITQLFFDNKHYFEFVNNLRNIGVNLPVIPGIMPIVNLKQIKKFTKMCGATLPSDLMERLEDAQGDQDAICKIGIDHATMQCRNLLKQNVPGIHFYTLNRSRATLSILESLM